jgi:hypothetical protein
MRRIDGVTVEIVDQTDRDNGIHITIKNGAQRVRFNTVEDFESFLCECQSLVEGIVWAPPVTKPPSGLVDGGIVGVKVS